MREGNVAFKVNWVYGKYGPFSTPCTAEGRWINICTERKVWCSQDECSCCRILRNQGNAGAIPTSEIPCYDAGIFRKWRFGGGVYRNGPRSGQPLPIRFAEEGKLAFFTAKRHGMNERDRIVIGCFEIARLRPEAHTWWGFEIPSVPMSRVRVKDVDGAPRFWDFYSQSGPPRWGSGLFRYLTDSQAFALRNAVKRAAG